MTTLLWIKAFHLIFMVAWFAGIFYLPRLFVYHAMATEPAVDKQLTVMERRLFWFVTPFAVLTVVFGLILLVSYGSAWFASAGWMHAKLLLVALLLAYHGYCYKIWTQFRDGKNQRSHRFYRVYNELPVIALFAIILLAVLKPF
ncbi:protoporphyrinogen oxidase HemJ [Idiomarina tyrosinivorans]|uniref:Protoporphyrinogen IX oxidase n=1 Tax=Idiomarina tyrosinivorans TaxID=1445662 RepID=A0A432ZS15_9GAMM|nr:protoporphyrinogen oxidase HemJ [Idiomarina tyrosinivorans]RUO80679.1 protoporphyrinogen oxidase HemJ [Idiomarina tyrosinivorans]